VAALLAMDRTTLTAALKLLERRGRRLALSAPERTPSARWPPVPDDLEMTAPGLGNVPGDARLLR